jgi:hypothetical protein
MYTTTRMRFHLSLLVLLALTLYGCDAYDLLPEEPNGLRSTPMQPGESLFGGLGKSMQDARYGCYVTSPNPGAPDEQRYTHQGFFVDFPQQIYARANGAKRLLALRLTSKDLYSVGERSESQVVRVVRCVIPDAPGAVDLVVEQASRFPIWNGEEWNGEVGGPAAGTSGKSVVTSCWTLVIEIPSDDCGDDPPPLYAKNGSSCTYTVEITHCSSGGGSDDGGGQQPGEGEPTWGSGGGGLGDGDSDPCDGALIATLDTGEMCDGGGPHGKPSEISQDIWDMLNQAEKDRCVAHVHECAVMGMAAIQAYAIEGALRGSNWQDGGSHVDNDPTNAIKHGVWNALMVIYGNQSGFNGDNIAKTWGDLHELPNIEGSSNLSNSSRMDFWNNRVGREIGNIFNGLPQDAPGWVLERLINAYNSGSLYCIIATPVCGEKFDWQWPPSF